MCPNGALQKSMDFVGKMNFIWLRSVLDLVYDMYFIILNFLFELTMISGKMLEDAEGPQ